MEFEKFGSGLPMRFLSIIACAVILICLGATPGRAETRVALIIGNGNYSSAARLPNPRNDAEDVAATVKRNGFETIVGFDLDQLGMQDAAIRFARAARDADVAIFYFSGHGLQFAGVNDLMPIDAKLTDEFWTPGCRGSTRLSPICSRQNVRILVLDSRRDDPLAENLSVRSVDPGGFAAAGARRIDAPQA